MLDSTDNFTVQVVIPDLAILDREQFTTTDRHLHAGSVMMLQLVSKPCKQAQQGLITHVLGVQLYFDGCYGRAKLAPRNGSKPKPIQDRLDLGWVRFKESLNFLRQLRPVKPYRERGVNLWPIETNISPMPWQCFLRHNEE
jgi:hypothetical protein